MNRPAGPSVFPPVHRTAPILYWPRDMTTQGKLFGPVTGGPVYLLRPRSRKWERLAAAELRALVESGEVPDESWVASGEPLRAHDFVERFREPDEAPAARLARLLELERPLVFFDLESTGTSVEEDRVVEFAGIRVEPGGSSRSLRLLVNPGIPIPAESSAIHGIADEDVRDAPRFADVAAEIGAFLAGADLAGYNVVSFDVPFLVAEFERHGVASAWDWFEEWRGRTIVDVCLLYKELRPRTLGAAHADLCGELLEDAHSALADVAGTLRVLARMLETGEVTAADAAELEAKTERRAGGRRRFLDMRGNFFLTEDGDIRSRFAKIRDLSFRAEMSSGNPRNVKGYLNWMLTKDFDSSTTRVARILAESMPVLEPKETAVGFEERWKGFVSRLG